MTLPYKVAAQQRAVSIPRVQNTLRLVEVGSDDISEVLITEVARYRRESLGETQPIRWCRARGIFADTAERVKSATSGLLNGVLISEYPLCLGSPGAGGLMTVISIDIRADGATVVGYTSTRGGSSRQVIELRRGADSLEWYVAFYSSRVTLII